MADDTSTLRVLVTTALGAYPLADAAVTVSTLPDAAGERTLLYSVMTDRSGLTPRMTLSTPPRASSLSPGNGDPYALYTVEVSRAGFTPQTALSVAMFADVPALLPVALTPLPESTPLAPPELTAQGNTQALTEGKEASDA